ncbi:hypothetical protein, partial [Nostoc sp. NMS4]|uniref:hypothetical protein n=1 Tax=Nostoc sp. NMS4 TaxID=2815390 RepID=UPI0025FC8D54
SVFRAVCSSFRLPCRSFRFHVSVFRAACSSFRLDVSVLRAACSGFRLHVLKNRLVLKHCIGMLPSTLLYKPHSKIGCGG